MLSRRPAAVTAIIATWLVCGLTGARAPAQEPASKRSGLPYLNLSPDVAGRRYALRGYGCGLSKDRYWPTAARRSVSRW